MSVAVFSIHSPWVKNTIRFLGALAIPSLIVWGFVSAQKGAENEYNSLTSEMKEHPTSTKTETTEFELKELDDNNAVRWHLTGKKGTTAEMKVVDVTDVKMRYFDGPNVKMEIIAPLGNVDVSNRYVKMKSAKGQRVSGIGDGGKNKFDAETIELDKQNQFIATGGVKIDWSDVALVTGEMAKGKMSKDGIQNVKVIGHTHAIIQSK